MLKQHTIAFQQRIRCVFAINVNAHLICIPHYYRCHPLMMGQIDGSIDRLTVPDSHDANKWGKSHANKHSAHIHRKQNIKKNKIIRTFKLFKFYYFHTDTRMGQVFGRQRHDHPFALFYQMKTSSNPAGLRWQIKQPVVSTALWKAASER